MFPASTPSGGVNMTMGPLDTCKPPAAAGPIPVPYANLVDGKAAVNDPAAKATQKQIINESAAKGYKASSATAAAIKSNGDQAGSLKGAVSHQNMSTAAYKTNAPKVMAEGKSVTSMSSPTAHSGSGANAPSGTQIAPSQSKVLLSN